MPPRQRSSSTRQHGWPTPGSPATGALGKAETRQRVTAAVEATWLALRCRTKPVTPVPSAASCSRRLADIESYVTTENRSLAREIEQLR